jgi:hypothetical protein
VLNKFLSTTSFVETNDRKEETESVGFDKLRGFKEAPGGSGWEVPGWPSQARIYVRCGKGSRQQLPRCVCKMQNSEGETIRIFLEKIEKEKKRISECEECRQEIGWRQSVQDISGGNGKVCWSS